MERIDVVGVLTEVEGLRAGSCRMLDLLDWKVAGSGVVEGEVVGSGEEVARWALERLGLCEEE